MRKNLYSAPSTPRAFEKLMHWDNIEPIDIKIMAEEEGFEPPRALTPLSVFKTDPFSRTWVFLHIMDPVGLEPTTGRL